MNKNILISSAVAAGSVALYFLAKRLLGPSNKVTQILEPPKRHLTDIFAKAKHA